MNRVGTASDGTNACFWDTGKPPVPLQMRGVNYVVLAPRNGYHCLFDPGHYDHATVAADMADIASFGFNYVRVYITTNEYDLGFGLHKPALPKWYLANLNDFLRCASDAGLWVALAGGDAAPNNYWSLDTDPNPYVDWWNRELLSESFVTLAVSRFWTDFFNGIEPDMLSTIFYVDVVAEASVNPNQPPFVAPGPTAIWGTDLRPIAAGPRQQALDDVTRKWLGQVRNTIKAVPGCADLLITASVTSPAIQGYAGYTGALVPVPGHLYPLNPAVIATVADAVDMHCYAPDPGGVTTEQQLASCGFAPGQAISMPRIIGETGADITGLTDAVTAGMAEAHLMQATLACKFSAWAHWTWNTPRVGGGKLKLIMPFWNMVESGYALAGMLSPKGWPNIG